MLHHYSLANDAVKAMLFGEAEEQQLVRTRIEAAEARRQAAIGQEQLQAEQQLAQARAQLQAQAQAPVVVAPPIVAQAPAVAAQAPGSPPGSPQGSPVGSPGRAGNINAVQRRRKVVEDIILGVHR